MSDELRHVLTATELERAMVKTFGPDFREKAVVTCLGSFRLADAFEECGLPDPQYSPHASGSYGLWQLL